MARIEDHDMEVLSRFVLDSEIVFLDILCGKSDSSCLASVSYDSCGGPICATPKTSSRNSDRMIASFTPGFPAQILL